MNGIVALETCGIILLLRTSRPFDINFLTVVAYIHFPALSDYDLVNFCHASFKGRFLS